MILLLAVVLGLTAGLCRARIGKRKYRYEELKAPLLVLVAFIPQYLIFFLPSTRALIPNRLASILYIGSLIPLIVFAFLNIRINSFWPISAGFLMNALAIVLNGGWMPISPNMVQKLHPHSAEGAWRIGERLGHSKDIVLQPEATRLWFLSDRFSLPEWLNYQVAFSLGDIFIFAGVALLLWSLGGKLQVSYKGEKQ